MAERYEEKTPVFVMAHSLGCMVTTNILTRQYLAQREQPGGLTYSGACLCNPFWGFGSKVVYALFPSMKLAYKVNPMAYSMDAAKFRKSYPEHMAPWVFDHENPI
mmetsp:Transcript_9034/g.13806  ORF Transcript_9034/g.13806 Transcript_9034/m.13806 type:complete len:105 (+) Transcript_9034:451-765(+)